MKNITILLLLFTMTVSAQKKYTSKDLKISALIEGTLLLPKNVDKPTLAIIIAGSGPTTRDGNQMMMKNNSLKFLAEDISGEGIATFRYDKRTVALMKAGQMDEKTSKFDDFIEDAEDVVAYFSKSKAFGKIYIIGHSQGSLVGMAAAQKDVDGFVSIAGAGQTIDAVIIDQLAKQAPGLKENATLAFEELGKKGKTENYSPGLASIFRPDLQPFIYNWMQYDPQELIANLEIPVLLLNGDKDIQVHESEAVKLQEAQKNAKLVIVSGMNHVLKRIEGNDMENQKAYNNPELPVMPQLVNTIVLFIKSNS